MIIVQNIACKYVAFSDLYIRQPYACRIYRSEKATQLDLFTITFRVYRTNEIDVRRREYYYIFYVNPYVVRLH